MKLSSPAFKHGEPIPSVYTRRDGENRSPPLNWSGLPQGTKSLALIIDDPDAPDPAAPKMTWVHWVVYNIPPESHGFEEGISKFPRDTKVAQNDFKKSSYDGPSPPIGTHRYFHKLYALDKMLPDLGPKANKKSVENAMKGHILDQTELIGTYHQMK